MSNPTRDAVPPVPAGKVMVAVPGSYDRALNAEVTVVASAVGCMHGFPTVRLEYSTRGFEIAGSMMRWTEARWSVLWTAQDGGIHGRNFAESNEAGARAYFAQVTDPQEVSRRRQEEARLEEEVYAPARAARAAEAVARAQAERDRKNALARFRRQQRRARAGAAA